MAAATAFTCWTVPVAMSGSSRNLLVSTPGASLLARRICPAQPRSVVDFPRSRRWHEPYIRARASGDTDDSEASQLSGEEPKADGAGSGGSTGADKDGLGARSGAAAAEAEADNRREAEESQGPISARCPDSELKAEGGAGAGAGAEGQAQEDEEQDSDMKELLRTLQSVLESMEEEATRKEEAEQLDRAQLDKEAELLFRMWSTMQALLKGWDYPYEADVPERLVYGLLADGTRADIDLGGTLRDEDGVPLWQAMPKSQLVASLESMAFGSRIDPDTLSAASSRLFGPGSSTSPVTVVASIPANKGEIFLGELRPGVDAAAAAEVLCAAVRGSFPGLRLAFIPFPSDAEDVAQQFSLDPARRCALLLFPQFSILHLSLMNALTLPALVAAPFLLKGVLFSNPAVTAGPDSLQAAVAFSVAALLPAAATLAGHLLWAAAYRKPLLLDWVPILAPGVGIMNILSRPTSLLASARMSVDFTLAPVLAALATSVALMKTSTCTAPPSLLPVPSLEGFGISEAMVASAPVPGTVLIREDILAHSGLLTRMADGLSCASLPDPDSSVSVLLAMPPLALAGLLGLHMVAVGLLPLAMSNGARLVEGCVRDETLMAVVELLGYALALGCLIGTWAPTWILVLLCWPFQTRLGPAIPCWDSVSSAGFVRSLLASTLIAGGVLFLLPPPVYEWVHSGALGPLVDTLLVSFLPPR